MESLSSSNLLLLVTALIALSTDNDQSGQKNGESNDEVGTLVHSRQIRSLQLNLHMDPQKIYSLQTTVSNVVNMIFLKFKSKYTLARSNPRNLTPLTEWKMMGKAMIHLKRAVTAVGRLRLQNKAKIIEATNKISTVFVIVYFKERKNTNIYL